MRGAQRTHFPESKRKPSLGICIFFSPFNNRSSGLSNTRNVLTFVNTTAIAGCQDQRKKAEFWRYAIAVVFTNVRTLRVDITAYPKSYERTHTPSTSRMLNHMQSPETPGYLPKVQSSILQRASRYPRV